MIPKKPVQQKTARWVSEPYRRAVAQLPCVNCGTHGASQCAHANAAVFGKGMGMKSHDFATFPLCHEGANACHARHDQRLEAKTKIERIDYEHNLIGLTMQNLRKNELITDDVFELVKSKLNSLFLC